MDLENKAAEASESLSEGLPAGEDTPDTPQTEPVKWATKRQRTVAWVLAAIVILITLAYTYAIATGQLFRY